MAAIRLCSVDGCDKSKYRRGFCQSHYCRWQRHGSPTGGGTVRASRGEPQEFFENIVVITDGPECLMWPFGNRTYGELILNGRRDLVHRFVCEYAHGPQPSPDHEAAHNCGNCRCVNPAHLRWATSKQNNADKVLHGTHARGENNTFSKLSNQDVIDIRSMWPEVSQQRIAERYGVSRQAIWAIVHRKGWPHLD